MSQTPSTAAIILAAGSSSRMEGGRHKLLLPLDERPVLVHVIEAVLTSQARPILLVLGHSASQVRTHIASVAGHPDLLLVENPDYLQGMSTSMQVGLRALMETKPWFQGADAQSNEPPADSALILLGDQPLVTPEIIDRLISAWRDSTKRIVAPLYEGKRGNPTLFAASLFPELLAVTGDEGGRRVVERHRQELETVELGSATASYDVDTWEAYQQVLEAWQHMREKEDQAREE